MATSIRVVVDNDSVGNRTTILKHALSYLCLAKSIFESAVHINTVDDAKKVKFLECIDALNRQVLDNQLVVSFGSSSSLPKEIWVFKFEEQLPQQDAEEENRPAATLIPEQHNIAAQVLREMLPHVSHNTSYSHCYLMTQTGGHSGQSGWSLKNGFDLDKKRERAKQVYLVTISKSIDAPKSTQKIAEEQPKPFSFMQIV